MMTNIPTDLLRTFVAVVDLRSFTKAAISLGITQPAVSAQIKRLQFLIGDDIFDRSTQGVSLTPHGEIVISYARRLLSLNDQIVHLGGAGPRPELVVRVGTPSDFVASMLPGVMAKFRTVWPDVRFIVRTDHEEPLVRALHAGEIDLFVGLSPKPPHDAHHSWTEAMVWVRGPNTKLNPDQPVPLVSYGEPCVHHRVAVKALKSAGLEWEVVFTGSSMTSLNGAVEAGLGVLAISRRRAVETGFIVWEDAPLPKLPDLYRGIYVREGGSRSAYEQLADDIAAALSDQAVHSTKSPAIGLVRKQTSAA
ncbi:MAG TPA: LysR family transcriptional regulator [Pseudolabrys sp.]|nr:LysR family transcriptional regulator [Pseudolabrys sp.]